MKRRQAIRQIVVVSSGLALLPSCDFQSGVALKSYQHLPLNKSQYRLIEALQAAIFPAEKMPVSDTETPMDYMLTRINDCFSMEDIEKYLTGMESFQQSVKSSRFKNTFEKLSREEQQQILDEGFPSKEKSPPQEFLDTNKRLLVEYFTRSEDYQVNHFGYEFIPSRYSGCVNL